MMRQRPSGTGGSDKSNVRPSQDYYGGYRGGSSDAGGGYGGYSQSNYSGYNAGGSSSYGGYSVPDAKQYSKSKKSPASLDSFLTYPLIFLCLLMAVWGITVVVLWLNVRGKYNSILRELNAPNVDVWMDKYKYLQLDLSTAQQEKHRSVRDKNREMNDKHDSLDQENRKLQKECEDLRIKHEQSTEKGGTLHKLLREDAFDDQMERLEDAIRKESHRTAMERFGPGPHEVEFRFTIKGIERFFVVEMAPLEDVPHAVHFFMEQVEHGLWSGCYFYLNGPHVVQAGPRLLDENDDGSSSAAEDRFKEILPFKVAGLDELSFPDYSEKFPHVTWTLGYTGRPGGVDWYINKIDNTLLHGPGGQSQHALEEQGDPCFGKIIRGQEHAAVLFQQPIYADRSDVHYFLMDPIKIIEAKVLTKRPENAVHVEAKKMADQEAVRDPIQVMNDKMKKRRPRLPKIEHSAMP